MRTSDGCWTCRLRRKKCDETRPVCQICAGLELTCHFGQTKPPWMDGGKRQHDVADKLKIDIKARTRSRRGAEASCVSRTGVLTPEHLDRGPGSDSDLASSAKGGTHHKRSSSAVSGTNHQCSDFSFPSSNLQDTIARPIDGALGLIDDPVFIGQDVQHDASNVYSDATLIMFFLDELFPWLYPFYRPSLLQGGRFWILEMMSSSVVRQTALCQSHYFYSLAQHGHTNESTCDTALAHTNEAFTSIRQSLQIVMGAGISDHMQCAARVLTGIVQIHRCEIAISSFLNWQTHLNAALDLLSQMLEIDGPKIAAASESCVATVSACLGHSSAEQAAFRFSTALLVLDDVVASIAFQQEPRLYNLHPELLNASAHHDSIDIEGVLGLQNDVVLHLGRIAALSAWKQSCRNAASLDVMEMASRAIPIKSSLVTLLAELQGEQTITPARAPSNALHFLTSQSQAGLSLLGDQGDLTTRLWAQAALIYLDVIVSGWQRGDNVVRSRVTTLIDIITGMPLRPALMHTIAWPLCVAGCFAEPSQRESLRTTIHALQPRSMFGTLFKALELMEQAWYSNNLQNGVDNISWCFQSQGQHFLLV